MCIIWRQQPYFDSHSFTRILGGRPRVPPSSFVLSANACCRPTPLNSLRFSPQTNALNFVVHSHSAEHSRVQRSKEWKARRKVFNFFFLAFLFSFLFPHLLLFFIYFWSFLVCCWCDVSVVYCGNTIICFMPSGLLLIHAKWCFLPILAWMIVRFVMACVGVGKRGLFFEGECLDQHIAPHQYNAASVNESNFFLLKWQMNDYDKWRMPMTFQHRCYNLANLSTA